jgi:hypothetical protein
MPDKTQDKLVLQLQCTYDIGGTSVFVIQNNESGRKVSGVRAMWGVRWDQAQGREADLALPCLALPSSPPFEPGKV